MPEREPWRSWDLAPSRVERPATADQVAELVRAAAEDREALLPVGAGNALAAAGRPDAVRVALCMTGLAGVVEYAPDDLTLTLRAGTLLAEVAALLSERRQWLPGAPADSGTVGGLLASGFTAPEAREPYGLVRERVLGMQVAGADGRLTRSGGRVVKNVAGYGLHRMHVGAGGALGIVTEACLRLEALPEHREAVTARLDDADVAGSAWRWLRREGPDPAGLEAEIGTAGEVVLRASFLGDLEPTRAAAAAVREAWGKWGRAQAEVAAPAAAPPARPPGAALVLRLLLAPSRVLAAQGGLVARARALGAEAAARSYPNAGEIRIALSGNPGTVVATWREVAEGVSAGQWHYRVEDENPGLAAPAPAWSADPAALRWLARLKSALDPEGFLRPGSYSADRLERAAAYFEAAAKAAPA